MSAKRTAARAPGAALGAGETPVTPERSARGRICRGASAAGRRAPSPGAPHPSFLSASGHPTSALTCSVPTSAGLLVLGLASFCRENKPPTRRRLRSVPRPGVPAGDGGRRGTRGCEFGGAGGAPRLRAARGRCGCRVGVQGSPASSSRPSWKCASRRGMWGDVGVCESRCRDLDWTGEENLCGD